MRFFIKPTKADPVEGEVTVSLSNCAGNLLLYAQDDDGHRECVLKIESDGRVVLASNEILHVVGLRRGL
jgi:hypothetical protein